MSGVQVTEALKLNDCLIIKGGLQNGLMPSECDYPVSL